MLVWIHNIRKIKNHRKLKKKTGHGKKQCMAAKSGIPKINVTQAKQIFNNSISNPEGRIVEGQYAIMRYVICIR